MKYDEETHTLSFGSRVEVEEFHGELSTLVRSAMVAATRHVEDAAVAKEASREVLKELHTLMRVLNTLRQSLPRHGS